MSSLSSWGSADDAEVEARHTPNTAQALSAARAAINKELGRSERSSPGATTGEDLQKLQDTIDQLLLPSVRDQQRIVTTINTARQLGHSAHPSVNALQRKLAVLVLESPPQSPSAAAAAAAAASAGSDAGEGRGLPEGVPPRSMVEAQTEEQAVAMAALEAATMAVNGVATTSRWGWRKGTVKGTGSAQPTPPPRPYKPTKAPDDLFEKRLHRAQGWQARKPEPKSMPQPEPGPEPEPQPEPEPELEPEPQPELGQQPRRKRPRRKRTQSNTPSALPQYRALGTAATIRAGAEIESEVRGKLEEGEIITALSTKQHFGVTRVEFAGGWVSMKTAKGGKPLLELVTGSIEM
jgi:hypothetical protein